MKGETHLKGVYGHEYVADPSSRCKRVHIISSKKVLWEQYAWS